MPTPSSGPISMSNIADVTEGASTRIINLNDSLVRKFIGVASGPISLSQAYNKPTAGSITYSRAGGYPPGSYTFVVPIYQGLSVDVQGGSGGGGGGADYNPGYYNCGGNPGGNGTESRFASTTPVVGGGGGGGGPGNNNYVGTNGAASGGDNNYVGNATYCRAGGAGSGSYNYPTAGNGGYSGRATKVWKHAWTDGYPTWESSITVTVGSAGAAGVGGAGAFNGFVFYCTSGYYGTAGSEGSVGISYN